MADGPNRQNANVPEWGGDGSHRRQPPPHQAEMHGRSLPEFQGHNTKLPPHTSRARRQISFVLCPRNSGFDPLPLASTAVAHCGRSPVG